MSSSDKSKIVLALCIALDETFACLERLTGQTKRQESQLHSHPLPDDRKTLRFVQEVLRHNLGSSKATNLLKSLQDMRSEIQICLDKLAVAFQNFRGLYTITSDGLERVATNETTFSTSTKLIARTKLVDWLKKRESKLGVSGQMNNDAMVSIAVVMQDIAHSPILVVFRNSLHGLLIPLKSNDGEEPEIQVGRYVNEDAEHTLVRPAKNL